MLADTQARAHLKGHHKKTGNVLRRRGIKVELKSAARDKDAAALVAHRAEQGAGAEPHREPGAPADRQTSPAARKKAAKREHVVHSAGALRQRVLDLERRAPGGHGLVDLEV